MTLAPKLWKLVTSLLTLILCSLIPDIKVNLTLYKYIYTPKQKFTKLNIGPKFFFSLNRIFLEVEHANLPKFARLEVWSTLHFVYSCWCILLKAGCAWFAYQRFRTGVDTAFAPSYDADPSSLPGAAYTSYPGGPDDTGYQEAPFSGNQQRGTTGDINTIRETNWDILL